VTTTLFSPGLNKPIGLGFVSRAAYTAGSEVDILSEGKSFQARIVDLPFRHL
jgi:glycine cleavage system aminomethyltransferase T